MASRGIGLEISEAMVTYIGEEGYDRAYGARPLRRAVVRLVEDSLSEALLGEEFAEGDTAILDLAEDGTTAVVTHVTKPNSCDHKICLPILRTPAPAFSASD